MDQPRLIGRRRFLKYSGGGALMMAAGLPEAGAQPQRVPGAAVLAYRILPAQWKTDEQFARLVALLNAHRRAVDEISLFDETFPRRACASLERLEQAAGTLKRRIVELHGSGFRTRGYQCNFTRSATGTCPVRSCRRCPSSRRWGMMARCLMPAPARTARSTAPTSRSDMP